ncbi:integral membrane protein [Pediococcus damnosus]|uniref:Integral membrane protein n=1 Tax=Pediococcus damnosus TaxID=51663 RepID=A0A0R2HLH2_9LACO|nr:YjzD family protein [Pediococcus damnosus]AMV61572.1 integral membrane protein [Pediococcus damnosus]AMV62064.1 integral membrane protein [Pediococcus damnosus]AMV65934.1 integral membrane protein [Pediococcus damnosus]AMV68086.1 integral membrane protein [Pediococcus damnosus]AMV70271.1 integral membrane protein [Pediococcus damnosus]
MMKQIVIIFWAFIFGEVIGAIGGALEVMTYKPLTIGIVAALTALITSNGISLLSKSDSVK